ncbi:MAG TPA: D-aminoacylase [Anaerolineaceae bacterium]|nr:D-aminoacylase [Anaerolineaceae bacterium]
MFDILIRGGTVLDGTGRPGQPADVGITGNRITAIGNLTGAESRQTLLAEGLVVAPGFIDMHSHGDDHLPFMPTADSKIHQGITTEVVGNCGSSAAPLSEEMLDDLNRSLSKEAGEKTADWLTLGEFFDRLERQGTSVNLAMLVGHGTIREKVMGMSDADPTPEQLAAMQAEVRAAIEAGAIGLSTGLIYTPNVYAKTSEIIELARTAAHMGGIYTSHIRGEGNTLFEAIDEALTVGRAAGIQVQISHLKASGVKNWHKMARAVELIEQGREDGIDVTADLYPYPASNTGLTSLVPAWAHVGGHDRMLARLQDPACRQRIHLELSDPIDANGVDWDGIVVSHCPLLPEVEGLNLQQISEGRKAHPVDAMLDLLVEADLQVSIIMFTIQAENMLYGLRNRNVMIGTDGAGYSITGPYAAGRPHPRNFGTFPRVLGRYVREQPVLSLPEAVWKMTGLPASRLRFQDRGLIRENFHADLVVFNPQTVLDTSTFENPHQYPAGIEWVLVNGQVVIAGGQHTGARPGRIVH